MGNLYSLRLNENRPSINQKRIFVPRRRIFYSEEQHNYLETRVRTRASYVWGSKITLGRVQQNGFSVIRNYEIHHRLFIDTFMVRCQFATVKISILLICLLNLHEMTYLLNTVIEYRQRLLYKTHNPNSCVVDRWKFPSALIVLLAQLLLLFLTSF